MGFYVKNFTTGGHVNYQQATKHKLLTREEEVELAKAAEQGSKYARERLITHNLRLALSIANKYRKSNLPMEDIIQESNIGLIKAVDRYDWRKGFRFSTYACWWIKQSVCRYISSNRSTIKVPSHASSLAWKIKKLIEEYEEEFGSSPTVEELADMLGVTTSLVEDALQAPTNTTSLSRPIGKDESGTLEDVIPDNDQTHLDDLLDKEKITAAVRKGLRCLTAREEKIIRLRFGITEDATNHEAYPISKEKYIKMMERK